MATGASHSPMRRGQCHETPPQPGCRSKRRPELAAFGLYRSHYRRDPPRLMETAAFDRDAFGRTGDRDNMHVSWVSGVPYAYALLRHGRRVGNERYVDGRGIRARPHRCEPHPGWDLLAAVDPRSRLDDRLAPRSLEGPRPNARRRDPVHAPRGARRALAKAARWEARPAPTSPSCSGRSVLTARFRPPTTSRPATPSRGRERPACRGSRRSSRPVTSRRPAVPATTSSNSTRGSARLRTSISPRPPRTGTRR